MNATAKIDIQAIRQRLDAIVSGHVTAQQPKQPLGQAAIDAVLGGGLARHSLHEVTGRSAAPFAAKLASQLMGTILWISTREREAHIFPHATENIGLTIDNLLYITLPKRDIAWAFEQALRANAAAAVIAETDDPPDFTSSRRLQLAAREGATLGLLLLTPTRSGPLPTSAAETRWRVSPAPSPVPWAAPRFQLELQKNKKGLLRNWEVEWDATAHSFHLAAEAGDRLNRSTPIAMAG
ncbi:MAG: ImuA family protein [Alphaproteobacteria bacterium]